MNNYYCRTLLSVPDVDWETVWQGRYPPTFPKWKECDVNRPLWGRDIYDKLESIDLSVRQVRVFKWGRNNFYPWHIDGSDGKVSNWAINWVVNGTGRIQWNDELKMTPDAYNVTGGFRLGAAQDKFSCQTIDSGHACLVRVDVPHRVVTLGDKLPRETISIFFNKSVALTFDAARELLQSVNLIAA